MKIVYLVQTPSLLPEAFQGLAQLVGDRLITLTFESPVEGAIFLPRSTWTQGRNRLLEEAIQRHPDFDYLVFCDDDLVFAKGSWRVWEEELNFWRPMIASPSYEHPLGVSSMRAHTLYNFDAMMNAFHRSCIFDGVILPYIEKYDHVTWWLSQFFVMHFAAALYPGRVAKFTDIIVRNMQHRDYPRIQAEQFEPFAEIYINDGWVDPTIAKAAYRYFNDLTGERYQLFQRHAAPAAASAEAVAAVNLTGPLLGARKDLSELSARA